MDKVNDIRKLRAAIAEQLVDGWQYDYYMGRVMSHAFRDAGIQPVNSEVDFALMREALRVTGFSTATKIRVWIAANMHILNDMLWRGAKRDACIEKAKSMLNGVKRRQATYVLPEVRRRDTRRDWKTVK